MKEGDKQTQCKLRKKGNIKRGIKRERDGRKNRQK
jgi:hypothetical protein